MDWYKAQCDGDWEHQYGIKIDTLDNPGWSLDIDLADTPLDGRSLQSKLVERSEHDWVLVRVKENKFIADGGPGNLTEMIEIFAAFVEGRPLDQLLFP